ncbi:hypothetical protein [Spirosoma pomorum]
MKRVWLTDLQLKSAVDQLKGIRTNMPLVEVTVPSFEAVSLTEELYGPAYCRHTLLFRVKPGTDSSFELVTPIQIVDEWLAREMQTIL